MKRRLVNFLKLLALVSLTTYLSSSGVLKAENDSKAIEITDQEGKQTIIYEESYALVIWAGNYQHWGKLNNVEEESKQVVNALEQRGFKATTVGNPTGSELEGAIKDFIDNYGYEPDNRLVIFFSGHGHTRHRTKGYLVPVDAQDPTSRKNERDFLRVALPMEQIIAWARRIEAKHVLFVFDSCFSGTVFKQRSSTTPAKYILDVAGKPVRQFLTAGDADEEVPAKSVFTPLFIRALNGEADTINQDGYVTGNELGNYLRQNLREYDTQQTPQFGTIRDPELDQGDIVFRSLTKPIVSPLPRRVTEINPDESDSKGLPTITPSEETPSLLQQESKTIYISKSTGVDYNPLRNLLVAGEWKKADEETARTMLTATGRVKEGWLEMDDYENFSCEDLGIIDKLWLESSQGKFGFSVQKDIYQNLGGTREYWFERDVWEDFSDRVGWRKGGNWLDDDELTFNLNAPQAHLPFGAGDAGGVDASQWASVATLLFNCDL